MTVAIFGGLGLIIGSFLNVVIAREALGESVTGRSHCPRCRHTLSFFDLIPLLSWVVLRGRCRYCGRSISIQYPLVELTTALLFVGVGFAPLPFNLKILAVIIMSVCLCIAVYDVLHMLMPDRWNYAFALCSLVYGALMTTSLWEFFVVFLAGPLCAFPLWALWALSRGRWMGLGDVKFALGIGWLLGPLGGFVALLGAFVLGAVVSVFILLPLPYYVRVLEELWRFTPTPMVASLRSVFRIGGRADSMQHNEYKHSSTATQQKTMPPLVWGFTMKSEVPFGPFLIVSCITIWFMTVYGISLPLV